MPLLGIVIPIYNEEVILEQLYKRLSRAMDTFDIPSVVCFVDDGSSDGSLDRIKAIRARDDRFRYLSFSRNFGHQTAVMAGLRELDADVYVVMDGDLQDPPEVIPDLLMTWRAGHEVVYCVRHNRKENALKRCAYSVFYRVMRSISYLDIPLDTGDFCLMDKVVVQHLRSMPEHNQFIRGLRTWVGFRQTSYNYSRDARAGGEPKYTLAKLFGLAYDGLISFSFVPLRLVMKFGFAISLLSFVGICGLIAGKLLLGVSVQGWTSLAILVLFMGGVQLLTLGVVGEYIARIFDEVKARPLYVLQERQVDPATTASETDTRFVAKGTVYHDKAPAPAEQTTPTPVSQPAAEAPVA